MAKVMITMPDEFLKQIDKAAAAEHRSRSEMVREAMRAYLAERASGKRPSLLDKPSVRAAVEFQDRMSEKSRGVKFNTVAFIRKMRGPLK
ncbi:MAG: ribbon-helix-helix protein, CopG family [Chloroflexi bacterium]|nr:ribbon-helix-helix protein, CopG family [Chloroflexota bacterium]